MTTKEMLDLMKIVATQVTKEGGEPTDVYSIVDDAFYGLGWTNEGDGWIPPED